MSIDTLKKKYKTIDKLKKNYKTLELRILKLEKENCKK